MPSIDITQKTNHFWYPFDNMGFIHQFMFSRCWLFGCVCVCVHLWLQSVETLSPPKWAISCPGLQGVVACTHITATDIHEMGKLPKVAGGWYPHSVLLCLIKWTPNWRRQSMTSLHWFCEVKADNPSNPVGPVGSCIVDTLPMHVLAPNSWTPKMYISSTLKETRWTVGTQIFWKLFRYQTRNMLQKASKTPKVRHPAAKDLTFPEFGSDPWRAGFHVGVKRLDASVWSFEKLVPRRG